MTRRAVVIGGGLAGLTAALDLIEAGWRVSVFESRRRLGGRAASFEDARSGRTLDNCQHVLMGCCTNLLDLYERLGVGGMISWHETLYWRRPDGGTDIMQPGRWPAPLHLRRALRGMRLLDRADRRGVEHAAWRMLRIGVGGRRAWVHRTFGDFLDETRQTDRARSLFWDPIIISACNLAVEDVSAAHGLQVFQESFMAGRMHATMGVPSVPLGALYEPAQRAIEQAGSEVHLGAAVTEIGIEQRRAVGVQSGSGFIRADAIISALPWEKLLRVVPDRAQAIDARMQHLDQLGHSPILGVHLTYDRVVMPEPHLVLPGRDVHWLFNKGPADGAGQHLHAVVSAADAWMDMDEPDITDAIRRDVESALPEAGRATLLSSRPIKERRATFRATPEAERIRPDAAPSVLGVSGGDIEGLYLAGDWCRTGWPATMEGAVRSGAIAARAVTGQGGPVENAPAGRLVRMLARRSTAPV